jgi:hypothetical protein
MQGKARPWLRRPRPLNPARTAAYPRPARLAGADTNGPTVLTARGRLARAGTPRGVGVDSKGLEVLSASGRNGLGNLRLSQTPRLRRHEQARAGARVAPRSVSL